MKFALFLYTGSDSTKAEQLKDYLQGKLRSVDVLAEDQKLTDELPRSDCVGVYKTKT